MAWSGREELAEEGEEDEDELREPSAIKEGLLSIVTAPNLLIFVTFSEGEEQEEDGDKLREPSVFVEGLLI